jgi:UDP-N-acetylmuramoyl-tripeptide--D-alanyl-D-alanine ligase
MKLAEGDIIESLAHAHGPEMRLQLWKLGGVTLINDAYNANPNSVAAALDTLRDLPTRGRRIAILGDMRELGESSDQYHREVGILAGQSKIDVIMCVGEKAKLIGEAAKKAGVEHVACFRDAATAARMIPGRLKARDLVVVKASRSIGLESVATAIADKLQVHSRKAAS